ncbi:MAG: peroxide stress protein YaaA [Bacteroidota bacterium]|nr:peroxide stress protein YaaA [Bacteroidota bacterium]
MLIIISPAKTLDMAPQEITENFGEPDFLKEAKTLIKELKKFKPHQLSELMNISPKLADLNFRRIQDWNIPFNTENAKQALLAFKGDVYTGIDADTFSLEDFNFVQDHLRILSGLYGVLRPLDLIRAYRLEMGVKFKTNKWKNLYNFWGNKITQQIQNDINRQEDQLLINLASSEYFKSIDQKNLKAKIITPEFKDMKNDEYKMISFYAKRARGMMTRFIVKNKITKPDQLLLFDSGGYYFNTTLSKKDHPVFTRG